MSQRTMRQTQKENIYKNHCTTFTLELSVVFAIQQNTMQSELAHLGAKLRKCYAGHTTCVSLANTQNGHTLITLWMSTNEYLVYICCTLTGSDTVSTHTGVTSVNNNSPVFLRLQLKTEGFCPNSVGVTVSVSGSGSLQSSNTSRGTTSSWSGSWEREPSGRSFLLSATTWHRTKRRYMWQSRYRPGSCPFHPHPQRNQYDWLRLDGAP